MSEHDTIRQPTAAEPASRWATGRHPVDVVHLVVGVAFLGLVATWALLSAGRLDGAGARWLLPLPWLLAGGAGLLALALGGRRSDRVD